MTTIFSNDVQAFLAKFFFGGSGPSHSTLTSTFMRVGYTAEHDAYQQGDASVNKLKRVAGALQFAEKRGKSRVLIEQLLSDLRVDGLFRSQDMAVLIEIKALRSALMHDGWELTETGHIIPIGSINLDTGGRPALEDQLARLHRNTEDPGLQLGTAKELLEATAKFVLEAASMGAGMDRLDFQALISIAIERLDLHPKSVDSELPGGKAVRTIRQSARSIAVAVNELRNAQGTGHGRTLPSGVSESMARYVTREAASLAEWLLAELKSQYGE